MDPFSETWERFVAERRLEFGGHTDPTWRNGHEFSASFIVPMDASRFQERLDPLRTALRPFPFVSLHPDRFMHVTLFILGFLQDGAQKKGEVSRASLAQIEAAARETLADFPAFTVGLANLNAFPAAAFVEVHDGGMVGRLRDALGKGCGLKKPAGPPHLTLAYFQAPDGTPAPDSLVSTISRYRDWPVGRFQVDTVEMTLLDLRKDYPEPETLAKIALR